MRFQDSNSKWGCRIANLTCFDLMEGKTIFKKLLHDYLQFRSPILPADFVSFLRFQVQKKIRGIVSYWMSLRECPNSSFSTKTRFTFRYCLTESFDIITIKCFLIFEARNIHNANCNRNNEMNVPYIDVGKVCATVILLVVSVAWLDQNGNNFIHGRKYSCCILHHFNAFLSLFLVSSRSIRI